MSQIHTAGRAPAALEGQSGTSGAASAARLGASAIARGAASFEDGEARLAPRPVQAKSRPGPAAVQREEQPGGTGDASDDGPPDKVPVVIDEIAATQFAAHHLLANALGHLHVFDAGDVRILPQREFQVAYDAIYGNTSASWQRWVVPGPGNLNGFAHEGVNYINAALAGLHTVVHEMLHNNAQADFLPSVGRAFNEGTCEYLTKLTCGRMRPPQAAPTCYPNEDTLVQAMFDAGLAKQALIDAYLRGGVQTHIVAWANASCSAPWGTIMAHAEAGRYEEARAAIRRKGGQKGPA